MEFGVHLDGHHPPQSHDESAGVAASATGAAVVHVDHWQQQFASELPVERQNGIGMIESAIAEAIPGLAPAETIVYMRSHKSMGWILGRTGRATGEFICPPLIGDHERGDH